MHDRKAEWQPFHFWHGIEATSLPVSMSIYMLFLGVAKSTCIMHSPNPNLTGMLALASPLHEQEIWFRRWRQLASALNFFRHQVFPKSGVKDDETVNSEYHHPQSPYAIKIYGHPSIVQISSATKCANPSGYLTLLVKTNSLVRHQWFIPSIQG